MGTEPSRAVSDCEDDHVPKKLVFKPKSDYVPPKINRPEFVIYEDIGELSSFENFSFLPPNVVHLILLYLEPKDLFSVYLTAKIFNIVGNSNLFWRSYYDHFFSSFEASGCIIFSLFTKGEENVNSKQLFYYRFAAMNKKYIPRAILEDEPDEKMHPYSIAISGTIGSGKSSILLRFTRDQFQEEPIQLMAAFVSQKFGDYEFEIWEKPKPMRYIPPPPVSIYRRSSAILLTFDLGDRKSFSDLETGTDLENYLDEISRFNKIMNVILVGAKSDCPERVVSFEEASRFAREKGMFGYVECSSKVPRNIQVLFRCAQLMIEEREIERIVDSGILEEE